MRPIFIALVLVLCLSSVPVMAADAPEMTDSSWISSLTELFDALWSSLDLWDGDVQPNGGLEAESLASDGSGTPTDSTVKEPGENAGGWADPLG